MRKRKIFIWALYDFANSVVMIAFFLYFSQWLVIDSGISDFWFNIILTIASVLYILIGPILGSIADKTGNKTTGIRWTTVLTTIFFLLTGMIATLWPDQVILAMITFTAATAVYMLTYIYYNSFLKDISTPDKYGAVSGWGLLGNYLGQVAAVVIALPFATGAITWWGEPGRAQAFLPATLIFLVLALPLLITFRKENINSQAVIKVSDEYRGAWQAFKDLIKLEHLGRFLLAYFFFNDAVVTASNNFPIYMERVFSADDTYKSLLLIAILVTSAIGSPLSGWVADRIGFKKTLVYILVGWIALFPILAVTTSLSALFIICIFMGLWFGAAWTVTRAMVVKLTPPQHLAQSYTYFTLMERFATFIGPVSWGLIVAYGPGVNASNYRMAVLAMAIFVAIGLFITKKLPADAGRPGVKVIGESLS